MNAVSLRRSSAPGTGVRLILFLAAALSAWVLAGDPGRAQEAETAAPSTQIPAEDLKTLIETLEAPEERAVLVKQLQTLIEVQRQSAGEQAQTAEPQSLGAQLLAELSRKIAEVTEGFGELLPALLDLPAAASWTWTKMKEPAVQTALLEAAGKLVLIFALALFGEWLTRRFLARPRRAIEDRATKSLPARVLNLLLRTLIDAASIAVFAAVAYVVLPLTEPRDTTRLVALALINANVLARLVTALASMVLAPRVTQLRTVPLSDETANYIFIWVRRLTVVTVYGYVALEAALLLGLAPAVHAFLLKSVGLVVALLMLILILQNRGAMADWICNLGDVDSPMRALRNRFADVWHVLAGLYVFAIYGVWVLNLPGGFEFLLRATALTFVIVVAASGLTLLLSAVIDRGFHLKGDIKERFPGLEARANRYLPVLHRVLRGLVQVLAVILLLEAWGFGTIAWFVSDTGRELGGRLITLVLLLGAAILVWEVASALIERYLKLKSHAGTAGGRLRMLTLLPLLRNALRVLLAVMVVMIGLSELGIDIAPLLAGAGVIGLAVGFGAQTLVKDLITGFFILVEDTLAVGDYIDLGGHAGTVEHLTVRTVSLRDISGSLHTIPWGEVTSIVNMNKEFGYAVLDVGVAYREDIDEVFEVLKEIGAGMQADETYGPEMLEPLEVQGLNAFGASSVDIRARIKTKPLKQWMVRREFFRRMKRAFDEQNIEIPFPHQTIYFGVDKKGEAPPARVAVMPSAGAPEPGTT